MIRRRILSLIQERLNDFSSVALVGPRQIGKTTIAREIVSQLGEGAQYLDLEQRIDRNRLQDAETYFATNADKLIVLDEIQRVPEIFQILRGQIDDRRRMGRRSGMAGKFLLLGSASMHLLQQSSESLAGRISYVELGPISPIEAVSSQTGTKDSDSKQVIERLWLKGGFPESYLREKDASSFRWRTDFITSYLERDIPDFGFQAQAENLSLFWRMIANDQGELFNAERYARSIGVRSPTITRYLDMMEKLLLVRALRPWSINTGKRLVKSPRPFVRDSGVLHALLGISSMDALRGHPVIGKSWEGFVVEQLIGVCEGNVRPYFYRTGAGAEADLVLEFAHGRCWAIEIKHSTTPTLDRGFHNAADDLKAERRILVHRGSAAFPMGNGVEAMPLMAAMEQVSAAI
jgi:uncharacterized protein